MQVVVSTKRGAPTPNYVTISNIEVNIYPIEISDASSVFPSGIFMYDFQYPIDIQNTAFTTILSNNIKTYPISVSEQYFPTVLSNTTITYPISITKS